MAHRRLGVALLLPEPLRREVDALRRAVGDGSLGRIPAHLTLVPPVNVREDDLDAALALLRDAAAETQPLSMTLGPPASFLPENPVLYLSVSGDLEDLARLREAVFRPPLERTLAWPYVPHVTLCDEGDPARIEAGLEALAEYRAEVTFDRVHLMHEVRDDEGNRVWRPLADAALAGRRVVGRGGLELEITESTELEPAAAGLLDREWVAYDAATGYPYDKQTFALTARREHQIVGFATGWTNHGVAYLGDLLVVTGERGQGIGRQLLAAFEDVARRRACRRLSLRAIEGTPAQGFYEHYGWRVESRLEDWNDATAAANMRKDL